MNIRTLTAIGLAGMALAFVGNQAFAAKPTFNCKKASKPSEYAICANSSLALLENDFVDLYYTQMRRLKAQKRYSERRRFRSLHRSRIYAVEACGAYANCIRAEYQESIETYINNMADH